MQVGVPPATVSRVLKRTGLSRLRDVDPVEPVRRYERKRPGEMIHIDIKKLGKFNRIGHSSHRGNGTAPGWEFVHVAIDGHSRRSFTEIPY